MPLSILVLPIRYLLRSPRKSVSPREILSLTYTTKILGWIERSALRILTNRGGYITVFMLTLIGSTIISGTLQAKDAPILNMVEAALAQSDPKQWELAREELEVYLQQHPKDAKTLFLSGVLDIRQERWETAEKKMRSLVMIYPEIPEPYNNLAVALAAQGKDEEALFILQQLLAQYPRFYLAYENLGDLLIRRALGAYAEAKKISAEVRPQLEAKIKHASHWPGTLVNNIPKSSPSIVIFPPNRSQ